MRLSDRLLTDLYQLAMMDAYRQSGMDDIAVFEMFVRRLPDSRGFLMAAGNLSMTLRISTRVLPAPGSPKV